MRSGFQQIIILLKYKNAEQRVSFYSYKQFPLYSKVCSIYSGALIILFDTSRRHTKTIIIAYIQCNARTHAHTHARTHTHLKP